MAIPARYPLEAESQYQGGKQLQELPVDPFEQQLFMGRTEAEISQIKRYMTSWNCSTYTSIPENILDHALRKSIDPLKYLRKAHNFNKKAAKRVPKSGYRSDGSAVYRKGREYLVVRPDAFGVEKIVTYGVNNE